MSYTFRKSLHKRQDQEDGNWQNKMSAGFNTGYYDVLARDLRHIHSGVPPSEIKFRTMAYHQGIDIFERIREQRRRPTIKYFPRKYLEYLESYDIYIPRAPAFRNMSKSEIDCMVHRLNSKQERPSDNYHQMTHQRQERSQLRSAPVTAGRRAENSTSSGRRKKESVRKTASQKQEITSKEHMIAIVERLYQGETHQSQRRKREAVLPKRIQSAPATGSRSN